MKARTSKCIAGSHNKQLQRTVIRRRGRAARAPFHYARASRWTAGHAAAELRRYAALKARLAPRTYFAESRRWRLNGSDVGCEF